jgi:hypothetical protein
MMRRQLCHGLCLGWLVAAIAGCATTKESDTSRTGIEQLLVFSAAERVLSCYTNH